MAQAAEEHDIRRDGLSQAERQLAALSPDYIAVDERSTKELLEFAKAYAGELNFFDVQEGQVKINGDWQPFFGDIDVAEAAAYLDGPEKFSAEKAQPYARPHFALFLTFLKLLRYTQSQLNTLTKRHLDYYYQQVLRLSKRGSMPDQVNVLVELAPRIQQFTLPAGTLLKAGNDSLGQALVYRTDADITANYAQVAKLHTLFADRSAVGLRDIWEDKDIPTEEAVMRLLELALGQPAPGDPLPAYPLPPTEFERKPITYEDEAITELETLYQLVDFVPGQLYLTFADYRNLVERQQQFEASPAAWEFINQVLAKAWQTKLDRTGQDFEFTITNPRDFDSNLKNALNLSAEEVEDLFDGIPEVVTLKDAYSKRSDPRVQDKIRDELYLPVDATEPAGADGLTFTAMMQQLIPIESNWAEIMRLLTLARQAKSLAEPDFKPEPPNLADLALKDFTAFDDIMRVALGFGEAAPYPAPFVGDPITTLAKHYLHLLALETYFYMRAEDFHFLMSLALAAVGGGESDGNRQTTPDWAKVYAILDQAHKNKVYADRRAALRAGREAKDGGFEAMLFLALGIADPAESQDPLDLLGQYSLSQENQAFLAEMRNNETTIPNDDPRWEKTYQLVERIQRVILPEPIPQLETWRNLYPLADAKSAVVKLGVEAETESMRWHTFGQAAADGAPPAPSFGWAISSPLLELSQGTRLVTLTLGFDPAAFLTAEIQKSFADPGATPFRIEISTEQGWLPVSLAGPGDAGPVGDYWTLTGQADPAEQEPLTGIQLKLEFGEDVDPLTVLPPAETPFPSPWPVLRLLMQPVAAGDGDYTTPYLMFKPLILRRVQLNVAVSNLPPSHLQNDDAVLKPGKPFEPFGLRPAVGSRFYLSHAELVNKKLDSLAFEIEWMGWPDDITTYYNNYKDAAGQPIVTKNDTFTIAVSLINRRKAHLLQTNVPLFQPAIANMPAALDRLLTFTAAAAATAWDRYLQWELESPDFQHLTYPGRAAALSIAMAAAIANKGDGTVTASDYQINPPYTPKIKSLMLTYTSSLEIEVQKYQTGQQADQLYHIQPFGYSELEADPELKGQMFLPQFDYEGELYIGIRGLGAAQTLSLLFQMAEGSADPDLPVEPVRWDYLSGNRWLSLAGGQLLADGTRGLINSGIVCFKLNAAQPNTLLDPELYWLRAAIRRYSNGVCDAIDIHPQAVSATFVDQNNAPDHLSQPLPPETITRLVKARPEVTAIRQPYASYGGKMPEQDDTFYTRISERLRHKNRAVAQWDYEHLILDHFPHIYKSKCLPATPDQPGLVTIVVIPDIRNNDLFDPFEPKAPANVIADIETFLAERIPAYASVTVKNAHYVPLKVRFAVRFQPGVDEGYAKQQLNDELNRFLSPWAYDVAGDIVIGGRVYANVIVNFIEERPYVDFVAEIRLFKSEDHRTFTLIPSSGAEGYWVEPANPDGVLVAARVHEIDIITETGYEEKNFQGINYMRIELDFIVG